MPIYKVLQAIMNEKDLTIAEIARVCGLPDTTVRSIIVREQKSVALDVAFKLSKGLNITLEELNGEDLPFREGGTVKNTQLDELLDYYRRLNPVEKAALVAAARGMADAKDTVKNADATKAIV